MKGRKPKTADTVNMENSEYLKNVGVRDTQTGNERYTESYRTTGAE